MSKRKKVMDRKEKLKYISEKLLDRCMNLLDEGIDDSQDRTLMARLLKDNYEFEKEEAKKNNEDYLEFIESIAISSTIIDTEQVDISKIEFKVSESKEEEDKDVK